MLLLSGLQIFYLWVELMGNQTLVWQPDALPNEAAKSGKQAMFLASHEDLVGFDGGKGSGKTDLLVMDCIRKEKLNDPRWQGVIFRREYKRLTEVIGRAGYWFDRLPQLRAHWQGDKHRFIFPSGAWLAFHSAQYERDVENFQGWEICDLKFDQMEEFTETQFDYLLKQNRTGSEVKPTVRWTANPLGVGRAWLKKRYVDGKEPGKVYRISKMVNGEKYSYTYRRVFSTVYDNPKFKNDRNYIAKLATGSIETVKAFLMGDWNVVVGQFFYEFSTNVHCIKSGTLPPEYRRLGGLDYGSVKSFGILAADYLGNIYLEWEYRSEPTEDKPSGEVASEFGEGLAKFLLDKGIGEGLRIIADTNMFISTGQDVGTNKTPADIISGILKKEFAKRNKKSPYLEQVEKRGDENYRYRKACNEAVRDYLHYQIGADGKVVRAPRLFVMDRCRSFLETFPLLVADENDMEDLADGQDDHDYDMMKMPFMNLRVAPKKPDTGFDYKRTMAAVAEKKEIHFMVE